MKRILLAFALLCTTSFAKGPVIESYSAVAMGTGGSVGGRSMPFDVRITEWTTDEQLKSYAAILKGEGPDKLRRALEKADVGQISPVGRVGNDIAIARKRQAGANTIVTIVTARIMPFIELYNSGRSTDYQFGFLQFVLDSSGKGQGKIMAGAKIRFNQKSGKYEIESYGNQYVRASNVRRDK